jgi:hypothetical protein
MFEGGTFEVLDPERYSSCSTDIGKTSLIEGDGSLEGKTFLTLSLIPAVQSKTY